MSSERSNPTYTGLREHPRAQAFVDAFTKLGVSAQTAAVRFEQFGAALREARRQDPVLWAAMEMVAAGRGRRRRQFAKLRQLRGIR